MADYPFIYNTANNSLVRSDNVQNQWTPAGPQPVPHPLADQLGGLAKFGIGVGALALIGKTQFTPELRGFDIYGKVIRAVEEYSPGRVLRTFQLSQMISPLETASRQTRFIAPETLSRLKQTQAGQIWIEHLERLTGRGITADITGKGIRFEGGKLFVGRIGGEVLLEHAGVVRIPGGSTPKLAEGYVRSVAGGPAAPTPAALTKGLTEKISFTTAAGQTAEEAFIFTGGKTPLRSAGRLLGGLGTTFIERFNQLARAPSELLPIPSFIRNIPFLKHGLGVGPSSGLKTLGKLTAKLGIALPAAILGYKQLDYWTRQASVLDNTIFSEGITAAAASVWAKGQIALSNIAEFTGGHSYRERQEEIAPGSTSLQKLLAFPIMGVLGASTLGYGERLANQLAARRLGFTGEQASLMNVAETALFKRGLYGEKYTPEILEGLDKRVLQLAGERTDKRLASWTGRLASKMAAVQERGTLGGAVLRKLGNLTPGKVRALMGAGAGLALIAPFLPGALVPGKRPEELKRIYSGEELVPIRKGRWWEMGRSPYEGEKISRFKQHWYPEMLNRARDVGVYGEEEISPFKKFFLENFTYELERKHYYDRPFPLSAPAFQDVPFIGPLLSATIGKIVKPPAIMHEEAFKREGAGGEEYLRMPLRAEEQPPAPELGEVGPGTPISPYGAEGVAGEQIYRMTEAIGLPGFTMTAIKEAITGEQDFFAQEEQLESAGRMYGYEREYWDKELGGVLGLSELWRRLYPHRRRQIPLYNPIPNAFADVGWLPGEGEKGPNLKVGDPFSKITSGEQRLPGPGYAQLFPELKGVEPKDYPLIHRFKILADVAEYTDQFKFVRAQAKAAHNEKRFNEKEEALYLSTLEQLKAKKDRVVFSPYLYRDEAKTPVQEMLAASNEAQKNKGDEPSWFERTIGSYWETLAHGAETPAEFLTPMSPAMKLVHMRTAVEDYAKTQVYSSTFASWGHPIRDFVKPFVTSMKAAMGFEEIPEDIKKKRTLNEYFDILEYVKATRLKRAAQFVHDDKAVAEFESQRRETLFGINPFTMNYSHLLRALPKTERNYFEEFSKADMEERAKIYQMVPENEKALYVARWKLQDATDLQQAAKQGLLSEAQLKGAEEELNKLYEEKTQEGLPKTQELWAEYLATRLEGESYPDWYRRTKLLEERLGGMPLPGPDWVGWLPQLQLEDVKLKVVENEGLNFYDYDMWPDRQRAVARKPAVEEAATTLFNPVSSEDARRRITEVLSANDIRNARVYVSELTGDGGDVIDLRLKQDRTEDIRELIAKRGIN